MWVPGPPPGHPRPLPQPLHQLHPALRSQPLSGPGAPYPTLGPGLLCTPHVFRSAFLREQGYTCCRQSMQLSVRTLFSVLLMHWSEWSCWASH